MENAGPKNDLSKMSIEHKIDRWVPLLKFAIAFVVLGLVCGAVWQGYKAYQIKMTEKAFDLLENALAIERSFEKKEGENAKETEASRWTRLLESGAETHSKYEAALNEVIRQYPKNAGAATARLKLGRFYFGLGQYDKATENYSALLNQNLSPFFYGLAANGLGTSLEVKGSLEESLKVFQEAAKKSENPFKAQALMGQARISIQLSKKEEAKQAWEQIEKDFPGTDFAKEAKALKELSL